MPHVHTTSSFPGDYYAVAWDRLIDEDPAATLFHSARFLRLWCRHLRGDCDLRLRFVEDDDTIIGVVPEVREVDGEGRRVVHFAGGLHVTDYLGPVSRPEDRGRAVDAWLRELARDEDWDRLVAGGLAEDAGWHEAIAGTAQRLGLRFEGPEVHDVCPRIDLAGGWDGYLERLGSKNRHEIRRKARRLAREAAVVKLDEVDRDDLDRALDEFIALHVTSSGAKGEFFRRPGMAGFFRGLATVLGATGELKMHRLDVDGSVGAMTISLVGADGEWGLYNSAFDQDLAALSPGMVLVGEVIRIAAEEGARIFDMLRGGEPYKYRFGAEDRRLRRLTVERP